MDESRDGRYTGVDNAKKARESKNPEKSPRRHFQTSLASCCQEPNAFANNNPNSSEVTMQPGPAPHPPRPSHHRYTTSLPSPSFGLFNALFSGTCPAPIPSVLSLTLLRDEFTFSRTSTSISNSLTS